MQNGKPGDLPAALDRTLGVPVRRKVRAALAQRTAGGTLPAGAPLPSVRELAATGAAPMAVTRVRAELGEAGLVEARVGSGPFVPGSSPLRPRMRKAVAALQAPINAGPGAVAGRGVVVTSTGAKAAGDLARPGAARIGMSRTPATSSAS